MPTPRNRLLFWITMLLPFTIMATLVPKTLVASLLLIAILFIVVIRDAITGLAHKEKIKVTIPDLIRLSKDRAGNIPISIHVEQTTQLKLTIGLPLPDLVGSTQDTMDVTISANTANSCASWQCKPTTRGSLSIDKCYFQIRSPYGFWNIKGSTPCNSEIRIYPDMISERRGLAALFLRRSLFGMHAQRTVGQGRDFEKLRKYLPGDSFNDIHWKATAKRGKPITKLFQVERTQEVYVIIDSSRLSGKLTDNAPALERFITSALLMGQVAKQQGDLFGILTFSNTIHKFIRAGTGKAHYNTCRDALFELKPEMNNPDFDELTTFIRLRLRRRALIIILTDLGDPVLAESFQKNIEMISRQHVIMTCMLKQQSTERLFSTPNTSTTDDLYKNLAGHLVWQNLQELGKSLHHHGVKLSVVENENMSTELVTQYMSIKARQLL